MLPDGSSGGTIDDVNIRPAGTTDSLGIALVHVRSWQAAYKGLLPQPFLDGLDPVQRGQVWGRYLSQGRRAGEAVLVAEAHGNVVGFVSVGPSRDADADCQGEVWAIYLLADFWGQGMGRALMGAASESLRDAGFTEATLWVLDTNERARRFYEAAGWAPDGVSKEDSGRGFRITEVRYRRSFT
jgi:ribosomal protein S18 acetylase RimI-like enzyme